MLTPVQLIHSLQGTDLQRLPYYANRLDHPVLGITPAQVNAGHYIVFPNHFQQLVPVSFFMRVNSAGVGAITTLRLGTDEATPVDIFSIPQANLTTGTLWTPTSANLTLGAGFLNALKAGAGIKLYKVGSDATGAFTIDLEFGFTAKG